MALFKVLPIMALLIMENGQASGRVFFHREDNLFDFQLKKKKPSRLGFIFFFRNLFHMFPAINVHVKSWGHHMVKQIFTVFA